MSRECLQCTKTFSKKPTHSVAAWAKTRFCSRRCAYDARKGKPSWNAGIKLSALPQYSAMGFQAGHERFTKNLHKFSAESIKKAHVTQRANGTQGGKGTKRPAITGPNHFAWKGGYQNRLWLARRREAMRKGATGSHTREEWEDLKDFHDHACLACLKTEPEIELTEDHIVPLSKGGSDDISNIQPLCRSCNTKKYNRSVIFIGQHSFIN